MPPFTSCIPTSCQRWSQCEPLETAIISLAKAGTTPRPTWERFEVGQIPESAAPDARPGGKVYGTHVCLFTLLWCRNMVGEYAPVSAGSTKLCPSVLRLYICVPQRQLLCVHRPDRRIGQPLNVIIIYKLCKIAIYSQKQTSLIWHTFFRALNCFFAQELGRFLQIGSF